MSWLPQELDANGSCAHNKCDREPSLDELLERVVRQLGSPARVIELCYWSRERNLLDIMRAVVAMPDTAREALEAFLSMAGEPEKIVATLDAGGRLTLASPEVAQALDLLREERNVMAPEIAHRTH
jgi:hypothetical protein